MYIYICCRANRAQYSEVSLHGVVDDEILDVSMPTVEGSAEDNGSLLNTFFFFSSDSDY